VSHHRRGTCKRGTSITAAEVLVAETLMSGRLQASMKSDMECSKSWTEELFSWLVYVKWSSGRAPKDWQTGWPPPYTEKETGVNAPTTGTSLSLALLEKCMLNALKKDAAKQLNKSWIIPSEVFVLAAALQTNFWTFHCPATFREILEVDQRRLHMFCLPRQSMQLGSSWKA